MMLYSLVYLFWFSSVQFSSVAQSYPTLCDPMDCSMQGSLSITNSWSLLKLMSIESVMPSNYLILYHLLFLWPSIFPSIKVFSNESALRIRQPKYWSFRDGHKFCTIPLNERWSLICLPSIRAGLISYLTIECSRVMF